MQLSIDILFGICIGICSSIVWAIAVVLYRSQAKRIQPLALASIKMWAAFTFMAMLVIIPIWYSSYYIPKGAYLFLASSIISGAIIADTLYLMSHERIGVSYAFPISMSYPILTYLIAIVFLNEALLLVRFLGVTLAITGIITISHEQGMSENLEEKKRFDIVGLALAFLASLAYAANAIFLQIGMTDVDPIFANFFRTAFASILFVPIFITARYKGMQTPSKHTTKSVFLVGMLGMGIGSLLYSSAVKFVGATVTSVLGSLSPLFAIPISVLYLKEKITKITLLGVCATISGVILVIIGV